MKPISTLYLFLLIITSCNSTKPLGTPQTRAVDQALATLTSDKPENIALLVTKKRMAGTQDNMQYQQDALIANTLLKRYGITEQKYWQIQYDTMRGPIKTETIIVPVKGAHLHFQFSLANEDIPDSVLSWFHIMYVKPEYQ